MKRKLIIVLLIWICFLLQSTLLSGGRIISSSPNLLLIITVSMGFIRGKKEGIFTGFFCGIIMDLYYGQILGPYALLYMYIGFGAGMLYNIYYEDDIRMPVLITFGADIFYGIVMYIAGFLLRGDTEFGIYIIRVILPEAIYTAILTLILYKLIYFINKSLSKDEIKNRRTKWLKG